MNVVPNHTNRILTTDVGSLPRPADLLAMIVARQEVSPSMSRHSLSLPRTQSI